MMQTVPSLLWAAALLVVASSCSTSDGGAKAQKGVADGSVATGSAASSAGGAVGEGGGASEAGGQSGKAGASVGKGGASGASGGTSASSGGTSASSGGTSAGSGGTSASSGGTSGSQKTYGQKYEGGQFNLGPVDFAETQWHNACAPSTKYAPAIQEAEGDLLAGLWNGIPNVAGYCDACISVTTAKGKSAILRVVTYGDTTTNSIDVSPAAYQLLNTGEYPRSMIWQFAECPDTGKIVYEFQTASSEYWTSLWVRNARLPLKSVEVQSANHASYVALARGSDGTLTDAAGFGKGAFSLRLTSVDGQMLVESFQWPAAGIAGQTLSGKGNFP